MNKFPKNTYQQQTRNCYIPDDHQHILHKVQNRLRLRWSWYIHRNQLLFRLFPNAKIFYRTNEPKTKIINTSKTLIESHLAV